MKREIYAAIYRQHEIFRTIMDSARKARNLHNLAWLDVYCIDVHKAA